ncbi:MAG: hypothetical protein R3E86_00420 [Pseudomonadales bacterium]
MKQKREPGSPIFWLTIFALLFVVTPYAFMGTSEPRLWNLPVWFHLSLLATLAIALLSAWRIWRSWHLEDDHD